MKRSTLKLLLILSLTIGSISISLGQCDYFDDFSSQGNWNQVGTLVVVKEGKLQYINGARDAVQRRVFKKLDIPFSSGDCWEMTLEFLPESVGSHNNGQPFTGHNIFTLTETDQDPNHDCPDLNCTGYPPGTQDVIGISYTALNPPDGDLFFRIRARDGTTQYLSDHLTYSELGDLIYVELKKSCSTLTLNIYSDEDKQNPLGDGPVSLDIPDLDDLNYIQHGNHSGGWYLRELTGTIDNVCIERFDYCAESFGEENYLGCEGDGYFVEVNGMTYDESNPTGTEILDNSIGCDSIVTIELTYKKKLSITGFNLVMQNGHFDNSIIDLTAFENILTNKSNSIEVNWYKDSFCIHKIEFPEKFNYENNKYIYVFLSDNSGEFCNSDTLAIPLVFLYIPNIFSPNQDQMNDIFYIKSNINEITYEMYIYDRWGEKIYYESDLPVNISNRGWDGTFKGQKSISGVYVYILILNLGNNKKEIIAGDVTLIN